MPESNISAPMREAVGRELSRRVAFPVSGSDIRRWAIAVYYPAEPPRLFWDVDYAKSTRHGGIVAPEDFNPFAWMVAEKGVSLDDGAGGPDRVEHGLGIEGPGLRNQLNGGLEAVYGIRMRPGDIITSTTRLVGYSEREGRLGFMLFTTTEDTWTNGAGGVVKKTQMTLIRY
jgi:hypothetical protein